MEEEVRNKNEDRVIYWWWVLCGGEKRGLRILRATAQLIVIKQIIIPSFLFLHKHLGPHFISFFSTKIISSTKDRTNSNFKKEHVNYC